MGKKIYEKQGTFIRRKFKTFCPTLPTWNGTLDRGLNTQHGVFIWKIGKGRSLSSFPLFQIQIPFFRKNNRYRNSSPLFLILK